MKSNYLLNSKNGRETQSVPYQAITTVLNWRKTRLIAIWSIALMLCASSISAQISANIKVYGPNFNALEKCNPAAGDVNLYVDFYTANYPTGTTSTIDFVITDNGNPASSYSFTSDDGSYYGYLAAALSGPGSHTVETTVTITINAVPYTDSFSQTVDYGPAGCKTVSGKIVFDQDSDCLVGVADSPVAGRLVHYDYSSSCFTTADANGEYSFLFPTNRSFSISSGTVVPNGNGSYYASNCTNGTRSYGNEITTDTVINFVYNQDNVASSTGFAQLYEWQMSGSSCEFPNTFQFQVYAQTNVTEYDVLFQFGDGSDTVLAVRSENDSVVVKHSYIAAGTYNVKATMIFEDGTKELTLNGPIYLSDTCGNVEGTLYKDLDANCTYSSTLDSTRGGHQIICRVGAQDFYASPGTDGKFGFQVPSGAPYTLFVSGADENGKLNYYHSKGEIACPAKYDKTQAESGLDFGVSCDITGFDLAVEGWGWGFRPGFDNYVHLTAFNYGCAGVAGTVSYELTSLETFEYSDPTPSRINGQVVEWDFVNLSSDGSFPVDIRSHLDSTAIIGDTLCHLISVTPVIGDNDPADNQQNMCNEIRGSWDPNDKTAYISGSGKEAIDIKATDALTYRLRFQNTGTDTAFNIYLLDTIDPNLDLRTFEIIGSSHNMKTSISPERVVRFEFSNILLPDDKTNEELSHGYVLYSIKLKEDLAIGTELKNTGYIYFDFNQPVITNTTVSTIIDASGIGELQRNTSFSCFPNPSSQDLNIVLNDGQSTGKLRMIDLLGKEVINTSLVNNNKIDVSQLHAGVYIIQIEVNGQTSSQKLIVTR